MPHQFDAEFLIWWGAFPRHTAKLYAEQCYLRARQKATAQELFDGIESYKMAKHRDAEYCHASTFLNQGRWLDELPGSIYAFTCPHTPTCAGRNACDVKQRLGR